MGRFVTDLNALIAYTHRPDGESGEYKMPVRVPTGWVKIGTDLNEGAGGAYLYFVFERCGQDPAITDIRILNGPDASIPAGYQKIPVDLNKSAGGAYLYAAVSRDPRYGQPIEDLMAGAWGRGESPAGLPYGYGWIEGDLNEGTEYGAVVRLGCKPPREQPGR